MLVPNRHGSSNSYRYGFNGQEKDDEIKGEGNSLDFGERLFDPRVGRWWSTDNYLKPWLSPYQFASNNPVNNLDPDGNDEIHFYYRTQQMLGSDGKAFTVLTLASEIIKNDQEHTFFMHSPTGATTQFHPFQNNRLPNQGSTAAYDNQLPMSQGIGWFFGLGEKPLDDYAYLGRLLQASPELLDHYMNIREDGMRFKGAVNMAGSVEFTEKLIAAEETIYAIVDGYYLVKGLSKFVMRDAFKSTLKATLTDRLKINTIRSTFKVGKNRNIGVLEGKVGGKSYYEVGVSGDAVRSGTVQNPTKRFFKTQEVGGYDRLLDSEVKLLEDFAQKYHSTPDIEATLKLTSERAFCDSCSGVIQQFKKMFKNVKIELVNGVK